MIAHVKEGRLVLHDVRMDYIAFGRGKKNLIMIQGLNTRGIKGAGAMLAWMYRLFARDYRVYLFDRREDIPDGMTVRDMAADIAMAMDALAVKRADVFGVSQGGMIAQYLAIDRPDLVNRMALAVTCSKPNETVRAAIERWIALTQQGEMKRLIEDMAARMYSGAYVKRYRPLFPLLAALQRPKDPQRFIRLARACLTCRTYEELDRIRCPVLVIGGRQDRVVGAAACEEIAHKLGCGLDLYEHLGHAAYEEAKDFNQRVHAFLSGQT